MLQKLIDELLNDFNDLAVEARNSRSHGLTGQISGLFVSGQHKDVKEKAEAAQVALRDICDADDLATACRACSEIIEAIVLATTKTRTLCSMALGCLQKLLVNDLLSDTGRAAAIEALRVISFSRDHDDDTTKLKLLQTCLTILQLRGTSDTPEEARQVLALCFRQLTGKNPATVTNTAAAIVRQAVAIVFEHAAASPAPSPAPAASPPGTPRGGDPATPRSPSASTPTLSRSAEAETPQAQVALTLLREVCRMARGRPSELLECSPPASTFLFEVIGDALRDHVAVFRAREAFVDMLREDVCGAVRLALHGQMADDGDALQVGVLRVVLQCAVAVVSLYGPLVATKSEMFLVSMLDGVNEASHLSQQVLCMHGLRNLCSASPAVHFMHTTFDMKMDHKLRAVSMTLQTAGDFVVAFTSTAAPTAAGGGDPEAVALLGTLWAQKMQNRQLSLEAELSSHAATGYGALYIVMLAVDVVTSLLHSLSGILDRCAALPANGAAHRPRPTSATSTISTDPKLFPQQPPSSPSSLSAPFAQSPLAATPSNSTVASGARPGVAGEGAGAEHAGAAEAAEAEAAASAAAGAQPEARMPSTYASQVALEKLWPLLPPPTHDSCRLLAGILWQPSLEVLSAVIHAVSAEALVVHALRALQALATAAGVLGLQDVMLATLTTICSFTDPSPPAVATPAGPAAAPLSATASPAPAPSPAAADTPEPLRTAISGTLPTTPARLDSTASLPDMSPQEIMSPMSRVAAGARPSATKREPAALLTPRNVQSFRTAFNVAHALYERLGPAGWRALLATVCTLDTVMAGPAGVALARPAHPAAVATSDRDADLAILEAAAAQLLHATADGTLHAALTVITALCDLSASTGILMQGGLPRDGSLERMAEVVICNRSRLEPLWAVFFERVRTMAAAPAAAERAAAAACLKRVVLTLLSSRKGPADSPGAGGNPDGEPSGAAGPVGMAGSISLAAPRAAAEPPGDAGEEGSGGEAAGDEDAALEMLLLDAVAQVCRHPTAYVDVRYVCVETVHVVLQAHGETLTAAWRSVLGILEDAATRRDDSARVVRLGHEALELLVADFLAALPRPLLRRALHVEACFVMQAADVNTCYAASLSLWRAADTIGRVLAAHMHADASDLNARAPLAEPSQAPQTSGLLATASSFFTTLTGVPSMGGSLSRAGTALSQHPLHGGVSQEFADEGSPAEDDALDPIAHAGGEAVMTQLASTLSAADCRELLLFVMECAQRIALEPRPEVRTGGIRLLFDIMTRHGVTLAGEEGLVWDMAFPLLMEVAKNAQLSDEAHRAAAAGRRTRTAQVLPVHHTRDSYTKEWLDTLDKALRGWAAFLRLMLPHVMHLPCFAADWRTLMDVMHGLITMQNLPEDSASRKVALTALSLFSNVVAPSATDPNAPAILWSSSWDVMCAIATAFATEDTRAHVSVRQRFMLTLAAMHVEGRGHISDAAYEGLLALLAALAAHPVAGGEMWPPTYIPPLQTTLAAALPDLLPPQDKPRRWDMLLGWLCGQMHVQHPPPLVAPDTAADASATSDTAADAAEDGGDSAAMAADAAAEEDDAAGAIEAETEVDSGGAEGDCAPTAEVSAGEVAVVPQRAVLGQESEPLVRKLWAKTVAEAAVGLMKRHMPWDVRGEALRQLAAAMRAGIGLRWVPPVDGDGKVGAAVPQAFVQSFVALVEAGLPGVHYTSEKVGASATQGVWLEVRETFNLILHPPAGAVPGASPRGMHDAAWEPIEEAVLDCLASTVLSSTSHIPGRVRRDLVAMVAEGCSADTPAAAATGGRLVFLCMRKLCVLCGRRASGHGDGGLQETHLEVAQLALPLFLRRCTTLLSALVAADAAAHSKPTPAMPAAPEVQPEASAHAAGEAEVEAPHTDAAEASVQKHAQRGPNGMHLQEPLAVAASARKGREAAMRPPAADNAATDPAVDATAAPTAPPGAGGADAPDRGGAGDGAAAAEPEDLAGADLELLEGLAVVVLQRLAELRVAPEVVDGAIPGATELRMLVERTRRARAAPGAAADGGERTHLFVVYGAVAECAAVRSRAVRAAAATVLRAVSDLLPLGLGMLGS